MGLFAEDFELEDSILGIELDLVAECMQSACMATITIRNFPDEVHERLKQQAKRNRRSLNQEVIAELLERQERGVAERERFVSQMIAESQAVCAAVKKPMSTEEIRRSMEEGRD